MGRKSAGNNPQHKSVTAGPIEAPAVIAGKGEAELKALMEAGLAKVVGHVDGLGKRLGALEDLKAQMDANRPTSQEIKAGMDSDQIHKAIEAQTESMKGAFNGRMDQIEAQIAVQQIAPVPAGSEQKSMAQLIHESDSFKSARREPAGEKRLMERIAVGGLPDALSHYGQKAIYTMGQTELGPLVAPTHRPAPAELLTAFSDIASWIPRVDGVRSDTYDFPRETEESRLGYVRSVLTVAVVSGAGVVATFAETDGFTVGTVVRFHTAGGIETARILSIAALVVTFTATLNFNSAIDDPVTSENYGGTAESAAKPGGVVMFERPSISLKTIAIVIGLTQQRLDSLPQFQGFLSTRLQRRARRNLGYMFLYGDDTLVAPRLQLAGYASETGALTYTLTGGGPTGPTPPATDTRADAITRAAAFVHSGNQLVTHLNINEWNNILLEKSATDSHYLHTAMGPMLVVDRPGMRAIGSMLMNVDDVVQDGDFFTVDHQVASEYPINEVASQFSVGFVNDDWLLNQLKVRWEDRLNHAILTVTGYIFGQMT